MPMMDRLGAVVALAAVTLWVGLGGGPPDLSRGVRGAGAGEMLASGDLLTPTLGGRPWLEKPPLADLARGDDGQGGRRGGRVRGAAAVGPGGDASGRRRLGAGGAAVRAVGGLIAGLVQATTAWTVMRGRLAEADMLLACLVTWTLVAFDRLRVPGPAGKVTGLAPTAWWRGAGRSSRGWG